MLSASTFLIALLAGTSNAASLLRRDSWGGALSLGPSESTIISAVTTLIPGVAPSTQAGELFLWPGMSNGTGDLVQTTLEQWPDNTWCGAKTGQWCVRASVFGSFGQLDGTAGIVSGTDEVLIQYTLESNQMTWTQTVTNAVTGAALSSYSHDSGPYMRGWGTGTECDDGCTGTIAAQTYKNTVITLAAADTTFGSTLGVSGGTTYTGLASSQGGKVWTIATISVPAMQVSSSGSTSSASTSSASTSSASTSTATKSTSTSSVTKSSTTTSSTGSSTGVPVAKYGQCGGTGFTGSTTCVTGSTCTYSNAFYSQCL